MPVTEAGAEAGDLQIDSAGSDESMVIKWSTMGPVINDHKQLINQMATNTLNISEYDVHAGYFIDRFSLLITVVVNHSFLLPREYV